MLRTVKNASGLSSKLTMASRAYQTASRLVRRTLPVIPSKHCYNISICHEKRFIWFRVAKVGTRTIFNAFEQGGLNLDAEHPMFCRYPEGLFIDYFKFAFVRNPWDRLLSCWRNKVVDSNYFKFSEELRARMQKFDRFVEYVEGLDLDQCDHHIRRQGRLIDINNIDFVGRFERFEEDLADVLKEIGISDIAIARKNASENRLHYRQHYDDALMARVGELYKKDIKLFGYSY